MQRKSSGVWLKNATQTLFKQVKLGCIQAQGKVKSYLQTIGLLPGKTGKGMA